MSSSLNGAVPGGWTTRYPQSYGRGTSGRLLVIYGRLLGPLLVGYMLFDRAFAYVHLPATPVYIGEMMLVLGVVGVLAATGYLRIPLRDEPVLALLVVFMLWGVIRTVPGIDTYGIDAIRDAVLWYYGLFALLAVAALARWPALLDRLISGLAGVTPFVLIWLPIAVVLIPLADSAPTVPFTTVSILSHKPGNAAIAALLVLGCMWLFREGRSERSRAAWSIVALVVIALAATQNRGGLLGVAAGAAIGVAFLKDRLRLVVHAIVVLVIALALAILLDVRVPYAGAQGRDYSASQLIDNITSLGGADTPGNLGGTVRGREELWSRILDKQVEDGRLLDGSGFGQNLAAEVGVYDEGKETLRSPHNSHLHVMARMGVTGIVLWCALWLCWYWRLIKRCRELDRPGGRTRRKVGILCLAVATAVLLSSVFDPQLEGPQIGVLLWTVLGVGVAVTSRRTWFGHVEAPSPADRRR